MTRERSIKPIHVNFPLLLKYSLLVVAFSSLVIYFWVVISRVQYPYELEWIEGGMAEQVQRLLRGESMYVAPGIDYVPFLYPPLYFYLSAFAARLLGGFFLPLRVVSIISSLVSFAAIFLIVRAETKNNWVAFLSTGLFAASYRVTGAWLDIGRVDSLFLAILLVMVYLLVKSRNSITATLLPGMLAAAAFLTKQTALIVLVPIVAYLFWHNWRGGLLFIVVGASIVGITTLLMDNATSGWYSYYVFDLLSQQAQWLPLEFISYWKDDLLVHLPFAVLAVLFFLATRVKQSPHSFFMWLSIFTGALACSFFSRVKIGGYDNVLLPIYAIVSIVFGMGVFEIPRYFKQIDGEDRKGLANWIQIACLLQLAILFYNPFAQIPSKADLEAGNELVEMISNLEGEVYLPDHGYLLTLAGRKTYAHHSAIWDVLRTNRTTPGKVLLEEELEQAISQQVFDIIILDVGGNYCCREIAEFYIKTGELFQDETTFIPVTGDKRRPLYLYLVKK